jgi:hypothetical protein
MAKLLGVAGVDAAETVAVGDRVEHREEEGQGVGQGSVEVEDGESVAHAVDKM